MTNLYDLTDAELGVIRRFISTLVSPGVQSILTLRVCDSYGSSGAASQALDTAAEQLIRACGYRDGAVDTPEAVAEAAPAFALVVSVAKATPADSVFRFPDDFLPSDALVRKCLEGFFDIRRKFAIIYSYGTTRH